MAKTCKHCGITVSSLEDVPEVFASNGVRDGKRRYRNECRKCHSTIGSKRNMEKYHENRSKYLLDKYGIDEEVYNNMFDSQQGCCAICKKHQTTFSIRLAVDHDHVTGKVRGLLCQSCNQALGLLQDSLTNISNALEYLGGVSSLK